MNLYHTVVAMSLKKAVTQSPSAAENSTAYQLNRRLQKCWEHEFEWKFIPEKLGKVSYTYIDIVGVQQK